MAKLSAQWHRSWFLTLPIYWAWERLCSRKFIQTFNFMMGSCIVTYKSGVQVSSCNLIAVQGVNMVRSHVPSPATLLMSTAPHIREAAPTQARHAARPVRAAGEQLNSGPVKTPLKTTIWPCQKGIKQDDPACLQVSEVEKDGKTIVLRCNGSVSLFFISQNFSNHKLVGGFNPSENISGIIIPNTSVWKNMFQTTNQINHKWWLMSCPRSRCDAFWMLSLTPHLLRWCGSYVCNHKCSAFSGL